MTLDLTDVIIAVASGCFLIVGYWFRRWTADVDIHLQRLSAEVNELSKSQAVLVNLTDDIKDIRRESILAHQTAKAAHGRLDRHKQN